MHKYNSAPIDTGLAKKSVQPDPTVFKADKHAASMDFSKASGSGKAGWYSPGSGSFTQSKADLQVIRQAATSADWQIIGGCWKGGLNCAGKGLILKFPNNDRWYLPLHHFVDSAILAWPVCLRPAPEPSSVSSSPQNCRGLAS